MNNSVQLFDYVTNSGNDLIQEENNLKTLNNLFLMYVCKKVKRKIGNMTAQEKKWVENFTEILIL